MPSLNATLAWATPVKVEVLGAHLEAYINLLPAINAIRLFHRSNSGAPITKLPVELLLLVEDCLISSERKKTRKAWAKDFKCFELRCEPEDHFSKQQVAHWRRMIRMGALDLDVANNPEMTPKARLDAWIEWNADDWYDEHSSRQHAWEERVGYKAGAGNGFFIDNADLVLRHFGLEISVSHARLDTEPPGEQWRPRGVFPTETTFAYFKLPEAPEVQQHWMLTEMEYPDIIFVQDSFAVSVAVASRLSEK